MILNEDKTNPDGIVEAVKNMLQLLIFLQENKNEFGDGGSDPASRSDPSWLVCRPLLGSVQVMPIHLTALLWW